MGKFKKILIFILIFMQSFIFFGCNDNTITEKYQLIRIHIRADSNSDADQAVKLKVRDAVRVYLEKELGGVQGFETAYKIMSQKLTAVRSLANAVLEREGFNYGAKARLNNEYFPARSYENIIVESGFYDALIIELGSGQGDNWWCVIYPPLCYLEAENSGGFRYKSYLAELYRKFFGG